eukprot:5062888-Prymnesium_polylepis.1
MACGPLENRPPPRAAAKTCISPLKKSTPTHQNQFQNVLAEATPHQDCKAAKAAKVAAFGDA